MSIGFGSMCRCNTTLVWPVCHTHMYSVFFVDCLTRTHVGALSADTKDVYPVCIALHMHIMPYDRLVFVELHIHN